MQVDNQQDLCVWLGIALDDFIELVYSTQDAKRVTQVRPAINFIETHYSEPLTLADIAKAAHLSVSRLSHIFREQTGITIVDYLTNVRINHAKQLLLSTSKSCTEICFEAGYNNQSYFTRTFRQITSLTPRQFREMNRRK
jgi:YesN/AraC family two-component response regulator